MVKKRYLTKSRFKPATECQTKLFYTGKSEYVNQNLDDGFLFAPADGGFQVGDLANCYFPGGHDIKTLDYDEALAEPNRLLQLKLFRGEMNKNLDYNAMLQVALEEAKAGLAEGGFP